MRRRIVKDNQSTPERICSRCLRLAGDILLGAIQIGLRGCRVGIGVRFQFHQREKEIATNQRGDVVVPLLVCQQVVLKRFRALEHPIGDPTFVAAKLDTNSNTVPDGDPAPVGYRIQTKTRGYNIDHGLSRFNKLTGTRSGTFNRRREIAPRQGLEQVAHD